MLYHLLVPLREIFAPFNVVRYLTFRTAAAVVTALVLSLVFGPWFVRTLRRLSVGQNIREVGPQSHQVKAGTPTMGGLLILFAWLVSTLLWGNLTNSYLWMAVGVTAVPKSTMIGPLTPNGARWMWNPVTSAAGMPSTVTLMTMLCRTLS